MRILAISGVLIATLVAVAAAQSRRVDAVLPPVFMGAVRPVEPPGQPGAWVLQVISRGGFEGRRTGDLIVRSDGTATLTTPGDGTTSIHPETLTSLGQRIRTMTTPHWTTIDSRLGMCSDCTATLIVLTVREPSGLVHTHTAFWDATTKAAMPRDLLRIHDLAMTIQRR